MIGLLRTLPLLALVACVDDEAPVVVFTELDAPGAHDADVRIDDAQPVAARSHVLGATRDAALNPTWIGAGPWRTVVVHRDDQTVEDAVAAGRTFIRNGGSLRLDAKLGAGDRGAFMGGIAATGAERAMLEVQLEDRDTLGARFVVRIHAVEGGRRPRDATPRYLQRPVPRGTYRTWIDVPERGGRYVVEVQTVDREGTVVGRAWTSPIAVERPWL